MCRHILISTEDSAWYSIATVSQEEVHPVLLVMSVTYGDVKSFVIYSSALPPKQEIAPNKQLARNFLTVQNPTAAEQRTLQEKRQLKCLQSSQCVSVMLYMVNFLMNLLSYSFHPN